MTYFTDVLEALLTTETAYNLVIWLGGKGVSNLQRDCSVCTRRLLLQRYSRNIDGAILRCTTAACRGKKVSVRTGSFFFGWKICLKRALRILWCWSQVTLIKTIAEETNITRQSIGNCFHLIREVICQHLQQNPIVLGVEGIPIEMDKSCFRHSSKYGRRRAPEGEVWVFGMVDMSHQPAISYMEVVTDRSAHTLYPIIRAVLNSNINVIVHTDRWATYNRLANEFNIIHRTVNHSDPRHRFISPDGVHTQGIESHWNRWKPFIKYSKGIRK